jgi:hypothetical protein
VRERVAEAIWQAQSVRATGRPRSIPWSEVRPVDQDQYRFIADVVIPIIVEACATTAENNACDNGCAGVVRALRIQS